MFLEKKYIYGSVLLATSVLAYMGCKGKFTALKDLIFGRLIRRDMLNLMPDIVDNAMQSLVIIEVLDESRVHAITGIPLTIMKASGFIVKEDGLIVTNAHAVLIVHYTSIIVHLMGDTYIGYVEDLNLTSDLATIRVPLRNLPALKLGSRSTIRPGEWVIAMGCPMNLVNTVTVGVVSCANRSCQDFGHQDGSDMEYIQTDACTLFGNSGGPLLNMNGEVIGINTFQTLWGASFSVPIDYLKNFLGKCASSSTRHLYKTLGISMILLTRNVQGQLKMMNPDLPDDVNSGVIIWRLLVGSPAYTCGLRSDDVVIGANGKAVRSSKDIYTALEESDGILILQIVRGFRRLSVDVLPDLS